MFGEIKTTFRLFSLQILVFAAFFAFSLQAANAQDADAGDVETGLVGWWKLDEANSPYADNSSTNLPASDVGSATTPAPAKIGNGINFISAGRIQTASSPIFAGLTEVSYAGWIRMNDFSTGGYNGVVHIQGHSAVFLGWNNNRVGLLTNSWTTQNGNWGVNSRLINGQWNHFVVTYDISAPQGTPPQIYINGVQYPHSTAFTTIGSYTNPASSTVAIGAADISGWRNFNGDIDDVRIYNRILSADDVALLYRSYPGQVACDTTNEAVMIFNHNEKVMQYCNGTDWVNVGKKGTPCPAGYTSCGGNPAERLVFVTSTTTNAGNSASALCQNLANAAGLKGTYLPWFSTPTTDVASTFEQSTVPYVKTNGVKVADDWNDLTDGSLDSAINVFETNTAYTGFVVSTRTNTDGTYLGPDYVVGNGYQSASTWTNNTTVGSSVGSRRYCFEQGPIASTGCTAPNGKAGEMDYNLEDGVMQYCDGENWISMGPKSAGAGVSAADLSPTVPTSGLIGHWPLNTNANDALGNSNGSLQNGATIITTNKKLGVGAVELDGTNDHVRIPTTSSINLAGASEMTVSLWVDLDSVSAGANSLIMWESVNGGNQEEPYRLNVWDAGGGQYFPSFELANASDDTIRVDAGNVNYNGWHHVVGTYDGAQMRIYVDGQLSNSGAQTGVIKTPVDGALNVDLLIGSGEISTARFTNGTIDDVRLYNRKLEPEEVLALYRASSLAAHWKMDETGTTTTAVDSSGNGFDAAMLNGLAGANTTAGKAGNALRIDGTDDRMTVPFNSALHPSQITFCAWVKVNTSTGGYPSIAVTQNWPNRGFNFGMNDVTGDVTWSVLDGAPNNLTYNTTVTNWHHYCGTADGTTQNLYVDGNLVGTQSAGFVPMTSGILYLASTAANSNTLNGDIDDIRMYNRVLSAEEIATLYATTGGTRVPVTGCPNIGDTCDDGSMYAGLNPDTNEGFYVYPSVAATVNWSNPKVQTYARSPNNGQKNHNTIINNFNLADYPSFSTCENGTFLNHDDWYLPPIYELETIYTNLRVSPPGDDPDNPISLANFVSGAGGTAPSATDGPFNTGNSVFWSSTEDATNNAWAVNFANGQLLQNLDKNNARGIICARKSSLPVGGTCSSPRGVAGEIVYNDDYNLMQYCNGSEWLALGSDYSGSAVVLSAPAGTGDCPNIGDVCPDGSVYAGMSPDGWIRMFTTPADVSPWVPWDDGDSNRNVDVPGNTSTIDGDGNTALVVATDADSALSGFQDHQQAVYCNNLVAHGKNDWYLPAIDELQVLYNGHVSIGGFQNTSTNDNYSSSNDVSVFNYSAIDFFDGARKVVNKVNPGIGNFRCVRKDAASTAADPCAGTPAIGTACNNGSIYAGTSPFDGGDLYMTNVSFETTTEWSSTETTLLSLSNTTNGSENTSILIGTGANYEAAQYCDNLSAHGETDWYLPAEDETNNFWNGGAPIGGVDTSGAYYWASTEFDATRARGRNYQFGAMTQTAKSNPLLVRCVRKVGGTPTDACSGSPSVGTTCTNGSIYAGLSTDGNVAMYATPSDAPGGANYSWNAGNASGASMPFVTADPCYMGPETGCQTGELNTTAAAAADSDTSNGTFDDHIAAKYCDDLSFGGETDWYLPAQEELEILYNNRAIGAFNGSFSTVYPSNTYWSSSEVNNQAVITYSFDGSGGNNSTKENTWSVRCVRK